MKSQYPGVSVVRRFSLTGRRLIWYKRGRLKFVDLRSSGQDTACLSGSLSKGRRPPRSVEDKCQQIPEERTVEQRLLLFA